MPMVDIKHAPNPTPSPSAKSSNVDIEPTALPDGSGIIAGSLSNALNDTGAGVCLPLDWPTRKKWIITIIISLTSFCSTCASSIAVPAMQSYMDEYGVSNDKIGVLPIAAYVLGLGCGPFISAPLSELYGRQPAYLGSLLPFVLFCVAAGLSENFASLVVLRFFAGAFGSTAPTLGVATIGDMFSPGLRGKPMSVYGMGPMAGPVMGSMLGYWIINLGWRWVFHIIAMVTFVNFIAFVYFTEETHAPTIEKIHQYRLEHHPVPPSGVLGSLTPRVIMDRLGWMGAMVSSGEARVVFGRAFSRPPRLLFTNPVCLIFSLYYAYIYAIIYLFLISVPLMYAPPPISRTGLFSYEWNRNILPFAYLGLFVGFGIAMVIGVLYQDRMYKALTRRAGEGQGHPEYRLVLTEIGMCVLPCGLLIMGWTANAEAHWITPQIGMVLVACGLQLAFHSIQTFLVDAFSPYSAAAVAGATACRSVVACILPMFTAQMFVALKWGWGGTLLAGIAVAGVPVPLLMFVRGRHLRDRFAFHG